MIIRSIVILAAMMSIVTGAAGNRSLTHIVTCQLIAKLTPLLFS